MSASVAVAAEAAAAETQPLTAAGTSAVQAAKLSLLSGMLSKLKENAAISFKEAKPWGEVFDRTAFAKPANTAEAMGRLKKNMAYFRVNYMITTCGVTSMVLLMNLWSLVVLAGLALMWFYFYMIKTTPVVLGGRELSDREKFLGLGGVSLVTVFFLTNVGAVIFYALAMSVVMVGVHAVFHVPDDLFLDEPAANTGGFLSLLTGSAPTVPSAVNNV